MTPERLATLCGLLPDHNIFWRDQDEGWIEFDSPHAQEMVTYAQEDADHLLMEALRAVLAKDDVYDIEIAATPALIPGGTVLQWRVYLSMHDESVHEGTSSGDPLHAILDAVREAGP